MHARPRGRAAGLTSRPRRVGTSPPGRGSWWIRYVRSRCKAKARLPSFGAVVDGQSSVPPFVVLGQSSVEVEPISAVRRDLRCRLQPVFRWQLPGVTMLNSGLDLLSCPASPSRMDVLVDMVISIATARSARGSSNHRSANSSDVSELSS